MQVAATQTDPCTVELDITVEEEQVSRTFDSVYREFSRYVNVPGFRPGKAPRQLVERYANMDKLRERALEKLIQETYPQALEQEGITPYRQASVQPTDLVDKQPYAYKVLVPLEPQVTLGAYTDLTIDKPVYKITDEMVENRILRLREERARMERVTDRGVEKDDLIIVENQVTIDGVPSADPARRQLMTIGANEIPGYDEAILGTQPGEERTIETTYPEDHEDETRAGKKVVIQAKVASISARKLPELDDDFAKQTQLGETAEELTQKVREQMEANLASLSEQAAEQRLIEKILEGSEVHFPEALTREEAEQEIRNIATQLRQRKMSWEDYFQVIGKDAETFQNELLANAAERIRTVLLLRQISIVENLQVDDNDVNAEFARLRDAGAITEDQYAEFAPDPERRLQVANALVQQRLHDFLFAHNTFNEVEATEEPEAEALEDAE